MKKKIIKFEKVCLGYGRRKVFNSLSFDVLEGDFLGIIGPNGSGKTTILRSIVGLLKPQQGEISTGTDLRFAYCMQRQFIDTLFPFTVYEIVMMARTSLIGRLRRPQACDRGGVKHALEIVGIPHLINERFYNLSGGQKQRTLLARALSTEPNFLVLDEPTTDLDIKARREILELVQSLHQEQKITIILVTHELNEVINFAQKFMFLSTAHPDRIYDKSELNQELLREIFETPLQLKEMDGRAIIY